MTDEKMREALEPCPFCGSIWPREDKMGPNTLCEYCGASAPKHVWNRLAALSTKQEGEECGAGAAAFDAGETASAASKGDVERLAEVMWNAREESLMKFPVLWRSALHEDNKSEVRAIAAAFLTPSGEQEGGEEWRCIVDGGDPCPDVCVRQGYCIWLPPERAITPPSVRSQALEVVEALRWLTHVVNGIGKGGGRPEDGEDSAANKAAQEALNAWDALSPLPAPPVGDGSSLA